MTDDLEKLKKIIQELNKETTNLYKIIEEKNNLIESQRHYIWEILEKRLK